MRQEFTRRSNATALWRTLRSRFVPTQQAYRTRRILSGGASCSGGDDQPMFVAGSFLKCSPIPPSPPPPLVEGSSDARMPEEAPMTDIEHTPPEEPQHEEQEPSPVADTDVPPLPDVAPDYSTEEV